jgi:hypothetical protein
LKKDKNKKDNHSFSTEEKTKNRGRISYKVGDNLVIKKIFKIPILSDELNIPAHVADKNQIKPFPLIYKLRTKIPAFPDKFEPSIESLLF